MLFSTVLGKFNHFIRIITTYIAIEVSFTDLIHFRYVLSVASLLTLFSLFL